MTDDEHLDQAIEAGRRAAEEITSAQLRETGNTIDFQTIARARARAIIAAWEASSPSVWHAPTEADQDGHPYWVRWTDSVGTWYDKAYFNLGRWITSDGEALPVTPDRVMRLPMESE